jgi:peptide deformylase
MQSNRMGIIYRDKHSLGLHMSVREILQLGNPDLHRVSSDVTEGELGEIGYLVEDLHDTMMAFRDRFGVGRAIAAPQIGLFKRLIYMNVDQPVVIINPVLADLSREMIQVWDDCMSFPNLLVKVLRHKTCTIQFRDLQWELRTMPLSDDLSELLQHEYDHLDGVLAVSRAIDGESFAYRDELERLRQIDDRPG